MGFRKSKSKKEETKTVMDTIKEKGLEGQLNKKADAGEDSTVLRKKVRNGQGVITGFLTNDNVVMNVEQIAQQLIEGEDIQAANREGIMSKLSVIDGEIITPDGHNLGHLPDN